MLKIDFVENEVEEDGSLTKRVNVVVNGVADDDSYYLGDSFASAHFYNQQVIETLTQYTFEEVRKYFVYFGFEIEFDLWDNNARIEVYCSRLRNEQVPMIKVDLQIHDWENWAKPWSMWDLAKEIEAIVDRLDNSQIVYWQDEPDSMLNGFGINYFPGSNDLVIKSGIDKIKTIVKDIIWEANENLIIGIDGAVVLTYFHFPEEIKAVCKQYLIYFAQFMADMNVFVDTELKEELDSTLFKIIPKDKEESLEKIRQALNIYMRAPSTPGFEVQLASHNDIAAKQWESNIYHLKSQLTLAASINQAHQATIEMLQLSNYQYKQLLESQQNKKQPEKEDIIEGIVSLKSYDGQGFSIDFAEILRRLKRKFGK